MNVWTDKIFKQINIIEGTKNTMETKHDFTQGNILKKLVLFMVPIFGALVLQAMYGAVDLIIVGWFGTTAGISAVSTGSNLVNLVVFTVTGLSLGITVLISRYIGEKKQERIGKVIGGVIWFFAILAVILTIALLLAAPTATVFGIILCSIYFVVLGRKEKI